MQDLAEQQHDPQSIPALFAFPFCPSAHTIPAESVATANNAIQNFFIAGLPDRPGGHSPAALFQIGGNRACRDSYTRPR